MNEADENENLDKVGFFKKVWYSVFKIEKYPLMAAQGVSRAISYLSKMILILALVFSLGVVFQTHGAIKKGTKYLENNFPEFSYKDGILHVDSNEPIRISDNKFVGNIIIDTNTDSEEQINNYANQITDEGNGIIILKDKVLVRNKTIAGNISYNYKENLSSLNISEFTKNDVINYVNSGKIASLYFAVFVTMVIFEFAMYFLTTLSNAIFLSIFGYFVAYISRIKMRYAGIFNMSVYALTLSIILNIIYIAINMVVPFSMKYFQVMYVSVAAVYLVAAILILKYDFMKTEMQRIKDQLEEKTENEENEENEDDEEVEVEKNPKNEKDKVEDEKESKVEDKKESKNQEESEKNNKNEAEDKRKSKNKNKSKDENKRKNKKDENSKTEDEDIGKGGITGEQQGSNA